MRSRTMRRMGVVLALGVAILAAVAVLAPGTSPEPEAGVSTTSTAPAAPAGALPDPCALVAEAEAETAAGVDLMAAREGDSVCIYAADGVPTSVRVDVRHAPGGVADLEAQRDDALRALGVAGVVDVPGLGDAAFHTTIGELTLLRMVCGAVAVTVGVVGELADPAAVVTELAGLALGRM